ncbi:rhodanese-like domain-containing protein [bacterium]|nr:rhodanese-like domain-containing protein [bacterium]
MKSLFRLTTLTILVLSLTFFIGCSSDDDDNPVTPPANIFSDVAQIGDDYLTSGTKNITADALWTDLQGDVNLFIIDLRSSTDFENAGHCSTAVNWSIANLPDNVDQIPSGAKVVCVCYTGQTASFATCYLNMMGINAYNLKWGMCGWTSDTDVNLNKWGEVVPGGQATETDAHTATTEYDLPTIEGTNAEDEVQNRCNTFFDAGLKYIAAADLYANLNDGDDTNDPFIINYAWPQASYDAGHIPGSILFGGGTLGPDEDLNYLPTDKEIVVWCYTGQTSAQVCTYLNMLGYDAYSLKFGMNAIDPSLCGTTVYSPPSTPYPVVTGPA